jgi:hypothetical protein
MELVHLLSPVTILTILYVIASYYLITPRLSSYFNFYNKFTQEQKEYYHTLPVSIFHAVTVCCLALYILIYTTDYSNLIRSSSPLAILCFQLSSGYFVGDLIVCFSIVSLREFSNLIHHIAAGSSVILGLLFNGCWSVLILSRLLSEFSTPCVHLRWLLSALKVPKTSVLSLIVAIGITSSFFLCRILILPYLWYVAIRLIQDENDVNLASHHCAPFYIQIAVLIFTLILDCLNLNWAWMIYRGFRKFMKNRQHQQ